MTVEFAELTWQGRPLRIEYAWVWPQRESRRAGRPLLVFLHEGLGSRSLWKDFPQRLIDAAGCRGLVYSRPGYGRSTPRPHDERWGVDYMHRQAHDLLPALLDKLRVDDAPWMLGHSDGASIALLYAVQRPQAVAGLVVLAPHLFVEPISVQNIEGAREAFAATDMPQRLAKHHDDVASAFWGWNDIWLDPAFRDWNIEAGLERIRCPLLAIQGLDDEFGTLEQIHRLRQHVPAAQLLELPDCGHSPHRDQPEQVIAAIARFIARRA
ncbi:MAG TPA: alpha/beta hydrolase [Rubrivivax sp.]|nr:alpha/beta hydrolase [Rubrivivax sp.]